MTTRTPSRVPFRTHAAVWATALALLLVLWVLTPLHLLCTPAHAAEPIPYDSILAADLADLGRALVQSQLPKGSQPLPATHPLVRRIDAAAVAVAREAEAFPLPVRERFARVTFVMAGFESGWQANPKGSNDLGSACGALQLHDPQLHYKAGVTCAMLRADLALGLRAGMAVIAALAQKHGSLAAGLTAYATDGTYHGWVLPLVAQRCKLAGVDCTAVAWPKGTP